MILFCLLWVPLFYFFWRTITGNNAFAGGVWALLAGSVVALLQFLLGSWIDPEGFGLSRWLSGFVDVVAVPVLAPFVFYFLFVSLRLIRGNVDFAGFALLWLMPVAVIRTVSWIAQSDPVLLVMVPILWTAIAIGISFFINLIHHGRAPTIILSLLGILFLPVAASSSYWAFYAQKNILGFLLFLPAIAPMLAATFRNYTRAEG